MMITPSLYDMAKLLTKSQPKTSEKKYTVRKRPTQAVPGLKWTREMDAVIGNPMEVVDADRNRGALQLKCLKTGERFWYHKSWVEEYDATGACRCPIFLAGCSCGEFEREMRKKGKIYNRFTRAWEDVSIG